MVFIGLEISSISTYILAGFRKGQATASESSLKYFLLGSFATAFFLYGIALCFGATGSTSHRRHPQRHRDNHHAASGNPGDRDGAHRTRLQGLARSLPRLDAGCLPGRARAGRRHDVHRAQGRCLRCAAALPVQRHARAALRIGSSSSNCSPSPACASATSALCCSVTSSACSLTPRIAHAGYLLVAFSSTRENAISAALFYTAAYAAMNVGAFLVLTAVSRLRRRVAHDRRLHRPCAAPSCACRSAQLLPHLADRNSLHRRILRQVLLLHRGHLHGSRLARGHRPYQLAASPASTTCDYSPHSTRVPSLRRASPGGDTQGRRSRWHRPRLRRARDPHSRHCPGTSAASHAALNPHNIARCQHPRARGHAGTAGARPVTHQTASAHKQKGLRDAEAFPLLERPEA